MTREERIKEIYQFKELLLCEELQYAKKLKQALEQAISDMRILDKIEKKCMEENTQLEHDILTMSLDTGNKCSLKIINEAEGRRKQLDEILDLMGGKEE